MKGNPVIFVHGIGANSSVWKKFNIPEHRTFYLSFSDRFGQPQKQALELGKFIRQVLDETKNEKAILVCHSMGGLVARQYLAEHPFDHRIEKLIMLSVPNLGSVGLSVNWVPLALMLIGLAGAFLIWPLLFFLIGLIWEISSYLRGILLLSPATWAMRPRSKYLKELNRRSLPVEAKYISIISDAQGLPYRLINLFLFREGGDGAVPLSSQRLSKICVANFDQLDYREIKAALPHFAVPRRSEAAILQALEL